MHHGEIRQRCVTGDALRELKTFCKTLAGFHQVSRQTDVLAFFGRIRAAGEHHIHHSRGADQPRQADRTTTAYINAAAAFGQRVVGRLLGDAHVRRSGKLKTAADHRAMQNSDGRDFTELNFLKRFVPEPGMRDALCNIAFFQL